MVVRRVSNMHSNILDVDAEARELAVDFAEASEAVARAQAAQARVLARAADLASRRVAALGTVSSREAELPCVHWRRSSPRPGACRIGLSNAA